MNDNNQILSLELNSLKKDVDRLEEQIREREKPWYKKASILISAVALMFSFGTTIVSYFKSAQQEVLASRIELREIMKDIRHMPMKQAEIATKYQINNPPLYLSLSSDLVGQNLALCVQALGVINRIESSWYGRGSVLDADFGSIANAFKEASQGEKALEMYKEAHRRAGDPLMAAGTLKSIGEMYLFLGNRAKMREYFKKASEVFNQARFKNYPVISKAWTNAGTQISWANAELGANDCVAAWEHLKNASPFIEMMDDGYLKNQQKMYVSNTRDRIFHKCGGKDAVQRSP